MANVKDTRRITVWPSLYDKETPEENEAPSLMALAVGAFRRHGEYTDKFRAPGFSPYPLTPRECKKHKTSEPHRCDVQVDAIEFAVFDVDQGDFEAVARCDELLETAGLERWWYTSFSYPLKESWRLVLSLSRPVLAQEWKAFRLILIQRFSIPADRSACSGLSHFYFLPACLPNAPRHNDYFTGRAVDVDSFPIVLTPVVLNFDEDEDEDEDADDTAPVDMEAIRQGLQAKAGRFAAGGQRDKAEWIRRALKGVALAEHGERNTAMNKVCGVMTHAFPRAPKKALFAVVKPSLRAMMDDGSSLTEAQVWRMLTTSRNNERARTARLQEFEDAWRARIYNTETK